MELLNTPPVVGEKWLRVSTNEVVEILEVSDMFVTFSPGYNSRTGILSVDMFRKRSEWRRL